jgi:hypothetical protein
MLHERVFPGVRCSMRVHIQLLTNSWPNAKPLTWHGYYAFRRGIATLASTISRDPMAAKGLLRHSSVNTTLAHYIKDVPEVTKNAMTQVEALFTRHEGSIQ